MTAKKKKPYTKPAVKEYTAAEFSKEMAKKKKDGAAVRQMDRYRSAGDGGPNDPGRPVGGRRGCACTSAPEPKAPHVAPTIGEMEKIFDGVKAEKEAGEAVFNGVRDFWHGVWGQVDAERAEAKADSGFVWACELCRQAARLIRTWPTAMPIPWIFLSDRKKREKIASMLVVLWDMVLRPADYLTQREKIRELGAPLRFFEGRDAGDVCDVPGELFPADGRKMCLWPGGCAHKEPMGYLRAYVGHETYRCARRPEPGRLDYLMVGGWAVACCMDRKKPGASHV